jgi:hypothetical protein
MIGPRTARPRTGRRLARRIGLALLATVVTAGAAVVVTDSAASARGPSHLPQGHINSIKQISARYFQLTGWAADIDTRSSLHVSVMVNGKRHALAMASRRSPKAPTNRGYRGSKHGFVVKVRAPLGRDRVCVVVANRGRGHKKQIGCRTRTLANSPAGRLDSLVQVKGGIEFRGAAWDPNTSKPISVVVTANGKQIATLPSHNGKRHRSYRGTASLPQGTYNVCVTGQNLGWGKDTTLGCKSIVVNFGPAGAITALAQVPGGIRLTGWAVDPDTTDPIQVQVLDGDGGTPLGAALTANGAGTVRNGHQFSATYTVTASPTLTQGDHTICVYGINVGEGQDQDIACQDISLDFNPTARVTQVHQDIDGVQMIGTAIDPDTGDSIDVQLLLDGTLVRTVTAGRGSRQHSYNEVLPADSGTHTVCAIAVNVQFGTANSDPACRQITLNYDPVGAYENLSRSGGQLTVSGWALDAGSTSPVTVSATLDGAPATSALASRTGADVPGSYAGTFGTSHGFSFTVPADDGEHTVCLTATNGSTGNGAGATTDLGCQLIIAVHPVAPSAPQSVTAVGGFGGATVSWLAPADDGGAPPSRYTVTSSPGGISTTVKVPAPTTGTVSTTPITATVMGLKAKRKYSFTVTATNVAGTSDSTMSPTVRTQAAPPPQTSPAPVSTSRYIRNIRNGSAAELATMRSEGATDASYNPSGHGYLVLLDIGGQDSYDGGVVLSATTRFVPYGALVKDVKAYIDGYASKQKPSAPVVIAIGTNNDMDVTRAAGKDWANKVIDPLVSYARKYLAVTIAGANDIEPGFRGSYRDTNRWLGGYLDATTAPFVFNGSADGCSWTKAGKRCNNGWTMSGLYRLAGGAAPTRIINLPQIYNTTMPKQWKYISLTGVRSGQPRINFGGTLTEWTACDQAGGCGSISGVYAWQQLWNQLQSDSQLKVKSLPYSTDLRIDK